LYFFCYSHVNRQNPEDSDLLANLGILYLQIGSSQKAFECLGSALTFDPSNYKVIIINLIEYRPYTKRDEIPLIFHLWGPAYHNVKGSYISSYNPNFLASTVAQ
jgi:tetratricopeptide (TPR) repeat protein